jgi:hypothetical protein
VHSTPLEKERWFTAASILALSLGIAVTSTMVTASIS